MTQVQPNEPPAEFRAFYIDGTMRTDTTYRTAIVESLTPVGGRTFLDVGAADGYEARALAVRQAAMAIAVEGKDSLFQDAEAAARALNRDNHRAVRGDIRTIDQLGLGTFDCVCCFGVLYHMSNPFNVLKRLRAVTSDLLLLETHIAPEPWAENLLVPKHRGALLPGLRSLYLDDVRFEGRICPHRGAHAVSKGSLDEPWTFWLTASSLVKALTLSGFAIEAWHHELDGSAPKAIEKFGRKLGFGHANTKIFAVARANPSAQVDRRDGTVSTTQGRITKPTITSSPTDVLRYNLHRVANRARKIFAPR